MNIDQSNFFVHSEYKDDKFDFASGNDIALIGIDQDQNSRLDAFIAFNQEKREKKNNNKNFLTYFQETNLFKYYQDEL